MAHFVKLNENNVVIKGVVIANNVSTSNGSLGENDMHPDGEAYCRKLFKDPNGKWKQTSYNHKFRKQYASNGFVYDENADLFISPKPFPSWILDNNFDWQPPISKPDILELNGTPIYPEWDEENTQWKGANAEDINGVITWYFYNWNVNTYSWENKTAMPVFPEN
jgi:hypothetical protein